MANLQKRFIYALDTNWYGSDNGKANEELYFNSIVFIHDASGKGIAIWAQGSYFEMNNASDVENIIKNFLNSKGTGNIEVKVDDEILDEDATLINGVITSDIFNNFRKISCFIKW